MFLVQGKLNIRTPVQLISVSQNEGFLSRCGDYFFEALPPKKESVEVVEAIGVYFHPGIIQEIFKYHPMQWNENLNPKLNIDGLL